MVKSKLQILLHLLLPDHLLDLALGVDVEGVFVQQLHLLQPLLLALLVLLHHLHPHLAEAVGVVEGVRQRWALLPHLRHRLRVAQNTQPCRLDLLRACPLLSLRVLWSSALPHVVVGTVVVLL